MSALDGWIDVFRTGTHKDSAGRERTWSESDLDGIVAAHGAGDPAPVVVGHPKTDDPAYGWIAGARRVGDRLQVQLEQVAPAFREAVDAGRYRGRSVSLAPTENGFRLRHLGFLGGAAPSVEGLAPTQFSNSDDNLIYEFASWDEVRGWMVVGRMFRRLREWLIEDRGMEAADKVLPDYDIEAIPSDLDVGAAEASPAFSTDDDERDTPAGLEGGPAADPAAAAETTGENAMNEEELKQQKQGLDQRDADLAAREAAFAAKERKAEAKAKVAAHVEAGRILPAEQDAVAAFVAALPDGEVTISFAAPEGDREVTAKPREWFLDKFLGSLPKRVDYSERAGANTAPTQPQGGTNEDKAVVAKAQAYQRSQAEAGITITFAAALDAVEKGLDK